MVSFGSGQKILKNQNSTSKTRNVIYTLILIDLAVILPSSVVFLILDFTRVASLPLLLRMVVPSLLLSVPVAILFFGFFLERKLTSANVGGEKENVVPVLMFLLFVFSMFGVYIPAISKLVSMVPSLYGFEVVGFATIFFYLVYVIKSVVSIL